MFEVGKIYNTVNNMYEFECLKISDGKLWGIIYGPMGRDLQHATYYLEDGSASIKGFELVKPAGTLKAGDFGKFKGGTAFFFDGIYVKGEFRKGYITEQYNADSANKFLIDWSTVKNIKDYI